MEWCKKMNAKRLFNSSYKNLESSKLRHKIIRGKAKQKDDKNEENDGNSYEAASF